MGTTKQSGTTSQTTTATPEERQMEQMQLNQYQQTQPYQTQAQISGLQLGNQLLQSFNGQQGSQMWNSLIGGVTPQQQQSMIAENQRQLNPQFQNQGILDSGLAYTGSLRAATDISNQNAQFNVGALQNALNLALSGQAQVQAPVSQGTSQLASQLAGLRAVNQNTTTTSNPFLTSLYQGLGSVPGNVMSRFGQGTGMFGGGSL